MTSVTRSYPSERRFSVRILDGVRKVTLMAERPVRSPCSTTATTRRTMDNGRGGRNPAEAVVTSGPRRGLPLRRDAATGNGIVNAVVMHPGQDADELFAHLAELRQCERRLGQLPRGDALLEDVIDRVANLGRRRVVEHPQAGFDAVGQERHR